MLLPRAPKAWQGLLARRDGSKSNLPLCLFLVIVVGGNVTHSFVHSAFDLNQVAPWSYTTKRGRTFSCQNTQNVLQPGYNECLSYKLKKVFSVKSHKNLLFKPVWEVSQPHVQKCCYFTKSSPVIYLVYYFNKTVQTMELSSCKYSQLIVPLLENLLQNSLKKDSWSFSKSWRRFHCFLTSSPMTLHKCPPRTVLELVSTLHTSKYIFVPIPTAPQTTLWQQNGNHSALCYSSRKQTVNFRDRSSRYWNMPLS